MITWTTATRCVVLLALPAMLSGCGGTKPQSSKPIVVPAPVANNAGAQPAGAAAKRNELANKAARNDANAGKTKSLPPGTDPRSVFNVSEVSMDVAAPRRFQPEDQFTVVSGIRGIDSTQMVVVRGATPAKTGIARRDFSLPKGFVTVKGSEYSEDGLPLRIQCEKSGTTMALVPAGVFKMGTNEGPSDCQPEFSLHLDAFYMDVFEVTVGDFEKYRQDQKEKKKPMPPTTNPTSSPATPVLGVPWGMAQNYARWLSLELPTEAEFEKAARGPNSLRTPWGDGRAVWPVPRTPETLTVTGAFATDCSSYGIHDLAGNAREWCSDMYSDHAHRDAVASSNQTPHNWAGPKKVSNSNLRVVKGNAPDWSAWARQGRDIGKTLPDVGFRCVLRITVPETKS
ncbi:MAG: SUMF1/EgtB/PvdO family nonheme iron enzyme [Candidatus Saccharimonas sp.]|nr:SUMF1/EgtB/PvdO family nonheme iron enzyme [Planctomycetaceae bacterium]